MKGLEKGMQYFRDTYAFSLEQKHHNGYLDIEDVKRAIDIALEEQAKENYEFLWGLLNQSLYDNNKPLYYKIDDEMKRLKPKANTRGHKK